MERKLIKQGAGGYTVYLPKKWIESKKLTRGDHVTIAEIGNGLLVTKKNNEKKKATVTLTQENKKDLKNILTHLYRSGNDEIVIKNADEQTIRNIRKTAQDLLLGFEIIETGKDRCVISNLSEPAEQKYDALVRRATLIIKETATLVKENLSSNTFSHESDIADLQREQDKIVLFCRRIILRDPYARNPLTGWELLTFLMHIEHAYHHLYRYAKANRVKVGAATKELLASLEEYFELFCNALLKKDLSSIHAINARKDNLHFGACYDELSRAKGKETVVLSHIRELFRLIQIASSPIFVEALDARLQ